MVVCVWIDRYSHIRLIEDKLEQIPMSNDGRTSYIHQGWLKIRLHCQIKWSRRYCRIDWDKALLFLSVKNEERKFRDYIKLLPTVFISEVPQESSNINLIEIRVENETHLLQPETKSDYDAWLLALKRTAFSRVGGGIFGQSLEETYHYALDKTSLVPLIVRQCCDYLLEHGSSFVGLFRIPGKQSSIRDLRDRYDRGLSIDLNSSHSPATISSLLKLFLQSLPEPIIPSDSFDEFLEIGSKLKYNENEDLDRLKQLIEERLSDVHYALLAYLCQFLKKLTEFEHRTKMDAENLALTFGNNLIRSAEETDLDRIKGQNYNLLPLIKVFIIQCDYLFSVHPTHFALSNQSLTKSSGFSSFSSLLSTQDPVVTVPSRSSSMPSINVNIHEEFPFDSADIQPNEQSFVTCFEDPLVLLENDRTIAQTNETQLDRKLRIQQKKRPSKMIANSEASSSVQKVQTKKTLANKFGKSLSNFKSTVSKAFHSSGESNFDIHSNDNEEAKRMENEVEAMKDLIHQKDLILAELNKSSEVQRLTYEEEKSHLNELIERLEKENSQLKSQIFPN